MTDVIPLPALDGRQPLGFLAGIGVLVLLDRADVEAALSWDEVTGCARIEGMPTLDELLDILVAQVDDAELAPGLPDGWLPSMGASGSDPARLEPVAFADHLGDDVGGWAAALWTDLALDKRKLCSCTPFYAPMGKQSMRTMFEKPADLVRADPERRLREALTGWQRVDGFTGENLDIRALEEAAESQSGASVPSGVPGATWLAWAGLPMFPTSGNGTLGRAVGWRIPERGPKRFAWPLWSPRLDRRAVEVLLDHPLIADVAWAPRDNDSGAASSNGRARRARALRRLGVFAVVVSVRRPTFAGKSDGTLVTERIR